MKMKTILIAITAGSLALSSVAFADSMAGVVVTVTPTLITIQKGTELWDIKRGTGTHTAVTGDLTVGANVTVNYDSPDAQKKELPQNVPTPTPAGG